MSTYYVVNTDGLAVASDWDLNAEPEAPIDWGSPGQRRRVRLHHVRRGDLRRALPRPGRQEALDGHARNGRLRAGARDWSTMNKHDIILSLAPLPTGTASVDDFEAHLSHDDPAEDCTYCAVRPMIRVLRQVWNGEHGQAAFDLIWSMQDGYGEPGTMPSQGYDWSGIRDSSPAAIAAMYEAVVR